MLFESKTNIEVGCFIEYSFILVGRVDLITQFSLLGLFETLMALFYVSVLISEDGNLEDIFKKDVTIFVINF